MNRKKALATEYDIAAAIQGKVSKLNCGGGLHLRVHKNENAYFQLRVFLDGKDTTMQLGKYPTMTLAQAREKADHYRAQMAQARARKTDLAFQAKLKKQRNESSAKSSGVFKNFADAAEFIRNLRAGPHWSSEIGRALVLQFLIPSRWNDIVRAQPAHFNSSTAQWMVSQRRVGAGHHVAMHRSIAYLSEHALTHMMDAARLTGNGEYLFPALARMSRADRSKAVSEAMNAAWPHYPVDPEGLPSFFKAMANQHSYFRPELIEDMVSHRAGPRAGYRMPSYILQRHALAEWWNKELWTFVDAPRLQFGLL